MGTVAGLAAGGVLLGSAPAQADSPPPLGKTTWTYSYSKGYCFYSKPLKKGLQVDLSGRIRYQRKVVYTDWGFVVTFHDPMLIDPKATLKTYNDCGKGKKPSKVSRTALSQTWYDYKCKNSVAVFLGRGSKWGISISGTRQCGRIKNAKRSTSYGKGSSYAQHNSGEAAGWKWGGGKKIKKGGKICLNADGAATAWTGNKSDTVIKNLDVCVPATYRARP